MKIKNKFKQLQMSKMNKIYDKMKRIKSCYLKMNKIWIY